MLTYDSEKSWDKGGNQIFSSSGCNDRVVSSRHRRAVIRGQHDAQLQELVEVVRQVVFL